MALTDFSRTQTISLKEGTTTLDTGSVPAATGNTRVDAIVPLLAATSDQQFAIEINSKTADGKLQSLWLKADIDCHVYTNDASGGTPDDNKALVAGVPVFFQAGVGQTNPFGTENVTALYVNVAGAVAGTLKIFAAVDSSV